MLAGFILLFLLILSIVALSQIQYHTKLKKQALDTTIKEQEISIVKERKNILKDKEEYLNYIEDLRKEEERLQKELDNLDRDGLPTQEQFNKALWYMKHAGKLDQQTENKLVKTYDPRGLYK